MSEQSSARALAFVRGNVQGVGFRWWTRARALELGLVGYARNLSDGRVEVCAQGSEEQIETLLSMLEPDAEPAGRPGRVLGLVTQWHAARAELSGFRER
ncbi:acylphosphatase [Ornithinimicrobium sp. Arc0846-15]|nr:acylphosphatase [Ornithinimicrobium laminariae]